MVAASQWGLVQAAGERERRVADTLVDVLVAAGIDTVFGVPGGTISPLHDALLDRGEVRVVTTRHEQGAMFAAAGYARASGKHGVVLVTSGPGVLNTMTGLASAWCDGVPVVVLAGEVPRALHGRGALQEGSAHHLDVVHMVKSITKLAIEVTQPSAAAAVLRRALATATSGRRGPVLLTLPIDVTSKLSSLMVVAGEARVHLDDPRGERAQAVERAAEALWSAEPAAIFAGSGTRNGDGPARLRALAEKLQCPVMTTPKAKGVFPETHPLSVGVFGHGGHPSSQAFLEEGVDVVLAVGTGMTDPATDGWSPLLRARRELIGIDIDALQLGRTYPLTLGIVGDAGEVLGDIARALPDEPRPARRFGRFTSTHAAAVARMDRPITHARALWELQQATPDDAIYTCDIGEHLLFATHYLTVDQPDAWIALTGLASMGASISTALGAKLAQPERTVVAICGDGGFAMMAAELATAAQYGIAIVVCVLDDGRYGMVENGHATVYGRRARYPTTTLDVAATARAAGARVVEVARPAELGALLDEARPERLPLVVRCAVAPAPSLAKARNRSLKSKAETGPAARGKGEVTHG